MLSAKDFVVGAQGFFKVDVDIKTFKQLKKHIINYLRSKHNYQPDENLVDIIGPDNYAELKFISMRNKEPPGVILKLKKALGLDISKDLYFYNLERTRDSVPFIVRIMILPAKKTSNEGFTIEVISEPAILYKIRQLGESHLKRITEFKYSDIIYENKLFVTTLIHATGAKIVEGPKVLSEKQELPTAGLIGNYGFAKTSKLLNSGISKIRKGDTEDGLTDLREAIGHTFKELVKQMGKTPKKTFKDNFKVLKKELVVSSRTLRIVNTLYSWLNAYLSEIPVHEREKLSKLDSEFLFSIGEDLMLYLIRKIKLREW